MAVCVPSLIGAILEGVGFVLVVWKLALVQWREVGEPEWPKRLRAAGLRALHAVRFRRLPEPQAVNLEGLAHGRGGASATVTTRRSPPSLEDRLKDLEASQERLAHRLAALAQAIPDVRQELAAMRAELQRQQEERDRERRAVTSTSVKLETVGAGFFLAGVVLTGIAAVTC